ncbi:MAG: hypothetical protein IJ005_04145 [Bacteroidales bacterium]|nr:hypothetical protein [Bacteroidales bacterium]
MLFDCLSIFSLLTILLLLKRLVNIYPSLIACLIRSKECLNLDSSVKLARDRNMLTLAMMLPFCLTACRFRLYDISFFKDMDTDTVLGMYCAVFAAYVILRRMTTRLFRPKRIPSTTWSAADTASFNFFIILTLTLLATGGILDILNISDTVASYAML